MSEGEGGLEEHIFGGSGEQRFTQDSPVLPEVWLRFAEDPAKRQDLLLTPHRDSSSAVLMSELDKRLDGESRGEHGLAYNEGYVVAYLDFHQLVRSVVPLSEWWLHTWPGSRRALQAWLASGKARTSARRPRRRDEGFRGDWLAWFLELVGGSRAGASGPRATRPTGERAPRSSKASSPRPRGRCSRSGTSTSTASPARPCGGPARP